MQSITLSSQVKIPTLGLGTWRSDKSIVGKTVENAIIHCGYRHIDCAAIYGNEEEIGNGLSHCLSEGRIERKDLFITGKLWNTGHHPSHVENACRKSLQDLQIEYFDLYLMHWGVAFKHGTELEPMGEEGYILTEPVSVRETWQAMEKLIDIGLTRSIGVANFTTPMIADLLTYARYRPVINQIEIHPYLNQDELVSYCHHEGIHVTAYSPLGSSGTTNDKPLHDATVKEISLRVGKTCAQVLIRWILQRGLITIPKTTDLARLKENSEVFDFELSEQDMEKLNKLDRLHRFVDPKIWWGIPYFQ